MEQKTKDPRFTFPEDIFDMGMASRTYHWLMDHHIIGRGIRATATMLKLPERAVNRGVDGLLRLLRNS